MSGELPTTALSHGPARSLPELAARYLDEYLDKIRLAVVRLTDDQLWWRPAPGTNSAGNLLVHLEGNLSLWILGGLGGREVRRDRAAEFSLRGREGAPGSEELVERLAGVVGECRRVLEESVGEDLSAEVEVQGYRVDRMGALFHAVEHMSYHTGQIVWIVKQLRSDEPLEFYPQHAGE